MPMLKIRANVMKKSQSSLQEKEKDSDRGRGRSGGTRRALQAKTNNRNGSESNRGGKSGGKNPKTKARSAGKGSNSKKGQAGMGGKGKDQPWPRGDKGRGQKHQTPKMRAANVSEPPSSKNPRVRNQKRNQREWHRDREEKVRKAQANSSLAY